MKILFTKKLDTGKRWSGKATDWPSGVYESKFGTIIIVEHESPVWVVAFNHDGSIRKQPDQVVWQELDGVLCICDDPKIASITFAGSKNYPDGRPSPESEVAS